MINPGSIPQFTGDLGAIEAAGAALSKLGGTIETRGAHVHSTFQGLAGSYHAPEAQELFDSTKPVQTQAAAFGGNVTSVGGALSQFAHEAQPIVQRLQTLKADATSFVNSIKGDDDWTDDGDKVDHNNQLLHDVNAAYVQFLAVEAAAANKIQNLYGGKLFHGGTPSKNDPYAYMTSIPDDVKTPWGTKEEESHWYDKAIHWVDHHLPGWAQPVWDAWAGFEKGFWIDGVWGTVKGLGLLAFDGMMWQTGTHDLMHNVAPGLVDQADGAAKNVAYLAADAAIWATPGLGATLTTASKTGALPGPVKDFVDKSNQAGVGFLKGLVAWDEWGKDPARASGAVTFNVLSFLVPGPKGAGAMLKGTAEAGELGVRGLGEAGELGGRGAGEVADLGAHGPTAAELADNVFGGKDVDAALSGAGDLERGAAGLDDLGKVDVPAIGKTDVPAIGEHPLTTDPVPVTEHPAGTDPVPSGGVHDPVPSGGAHDPVPSGGAHDPAPSGGAHDPVPSGGAHDPAPPGGEPAGTDPAPADAGGDAPHGGAGDGGGTPPHDGPPAEGSPPPSGKPTPPAPRVDDWQTALDRGYDHEAYQRHVDDLYANHRDVIDDVGYGPRDKPVVPEQYHGNVSEIRSGSADSIWNPDRANAGWNQEFRGAHLKPNHAYVVDDRYLYLTDDAGRVSHTEGWLDYDWRNGTEYGYRRGPDQGMVGKLVFDEGDRGGHIIGAKFLGAGERGNMHPMLDALNGSGKGGFGEFEKALAAERGGLAPKPVHVNFDFDFPGKSLRPDGFDVQYRIADSPPAIRDFINAEPEGVPRKDILDTDGIASLDGDAVSPGPAGTLPADSGGLSAAHAGIEPHAGVGPHAAGPTPGGVADPGGAASGGEAASAAPEHTVVHPVHADAAVPDSGAGAGGDAPAGHGVGDVAAGGDVADANLSLPADVGAAGDAQHIPPNLNDDWRLGPADMPRQDGLVGGLLDGYERFRGAGGPDDYLHQWWNPRDGDWTYPPEEGYRLEDHDGTMLPDRQSFDVQPGDHIDRFGAQSGSYLSPEGTPFTERALPPSSLTPAPWDSHPAPYNYHRYEVLKPFTVDAGHVAPWFGQDGGGIQFKLQGEHIPGAPEKLTVEWLLDPENGYLREIE